MALIQKIKGLTPSIHPSVWLAENATLTGDIEIGEESSVWYQAVIRGDVNKIIIGKRVNIQDAAIVHGTLGKKDTIIEDGVTIGHRAIIHGCHIKKNALIGMGATVLDDAIVESGCIVAAGAVVTSGTHLESGYIYAGIPAKKMKEISEGQAQIYLQGTTDLYVHLSRLYKEEQQEA